MSVSVKRAIGSCHKLVKNIVMDEALSIFSVVNIFDNEEIEKDEILE